MFDKIDSYCSFSTAWFTMKKDWSFGTMRKLIKSWSFLQAIGDSVKSRSIIDHFLSEISTKLFLVDSKLRSHLLQGFKKILHLNF